MPKNAIISEVKTLSCSNSWRNYNFLRIVTEDGTVGWSEFDENFGSPGVTNVISQISHRLIGQSAMNHEHIREDLRDCTRPGSGGVVGQALGAIENALLDVKAKTLDVPCYALLGGKVRDKVRVYWSHCVSYRARTDHFSPGITDIEGVRQIGREVGEKGFTALKTNIFHYDDQNRISGWSPGFGRPHDPARNVERKTVKDLRKHLEVMREAAGPDIDLLLDLNFNGKTEGYLKLLREIEDLDLFWVEIDTLDPKALAYIRSHTKHPISSCETLIGLQQFLPFFREQAVDVAIIDTPWNGVWQSLKIAAAAEAYETNVAPHNFYGHLCTMMNAHFSAVVPNLRIMETDIDRIAWDAELFTHVPVYKDGYLIIPDRPGWGTEPNEAALHAYPPLETVGPAKKTPVPRLSI
ncbi:mandelate racemase/muconate lactonizing enzyme family protein [Microvirga lotononidis]|uniref:Enolase superfamily enzyme related to L-alanine-DL-glutamate epimerase n=1 Tax=Microvirga lotononidis TaxID=864069 RepID=I4Z155_9HYPH|nr:mandelate racemase/muconate lactonizing enzyme family protein [Microvirga lotononidis]EIM29947.1 enolase superfamily enzyme related to L-alanine-DL-glutamate epimerase [Microvirga lotononidis]WQO31991.1 mandelate racemase/muconate lactonizing enzyme family protein [Microvirga lotononidis]